MSGSEYPPLKLKTGNGTGQTGSLILRIEAGTDFTGSQNLGTGTRTTALVPIPWFFVKKKS